MKFTMQFRKYRVLLTNKYRHEYWFYETPYMSLSIYNLWWTLKEVQFFEKNPLYLPELGENFLKGTADISRQSRCRGSVSIIGTCEVYLAARIQHFEVCLWCKLKKSLTAGGEWTTNSWRMQNLRQSFSGSCHGEGGYRTHKSKSRFL